MTTIIFENDEAIELSYSEALSAKLASRRIFISRPGAAPPSSLILPKNAKLEAFSHFAFTKQLFSIGSFSYIESSHENHNMRVGRYTSIGNGVKMFGERHPSEWVTQSNFTYNIGYPHVAAGRAELLGNEEVYHPRELGYLGADIGNDVWIGDDVKIAQKVVIGHGAIVAAGSIVTRDVAPYTVVAGVPARPVKKRFDDVLCSLLIQTNWWDYHPKYLYQFNLRDPFQFADRFLEARYRGKLEPYSPLETTWKDLVE